MGFKWLLQTHVLSGMDPVFLLSGMYPGLSSKSEMELIDLGACFLFDVIVFIPGVTVQGLRWCLKATRGALQYTTFYMFDSFAWYYWGRTNISLVPLPVTNGTVIITQSCTGNSAQSKTELPDWRHIDRYQYSAGSVCPLVFVYSALFC
jgi:hypothetical protein